MCFIAFFFSVMYDYTGLLCYNCTMTGLILIICPGLCFVFGGPFSNEEDILTLTVFPNGTTRRSVPYLTPTLARFCGVVTPPKTNRWNPKNDGIEDESPFISGWFFRFQCEVTAVCSSRPRKDYFFLPWPKLAPLKSTITNIINFEK